ncbi:MAG: hypothetical protein A2887_00265 [Alphaproteobacteria bacterium RIFCSPLOWO2_01_FULL_40_26]|nr:MAG: hypothetical protein A3D15_06695 [Alphaproteobacteria bacterium RIFCSPHIGHO2_02_FULL_40_34]OFW89036.1 MAG: hypothetical protein A2794_01625 [Alphaproteobacteria bacterium RIFCSPHIGHO2_01_FULL_40_8]OFW94623.1 MAG: hypothetical protein A2887_00265 [Alphaproteobacteria bacterium RIFCSPLOWO2_01_FULL_40_26]OFX10091.1 MAG: hypothetical protein A3H30_04725 [Alphaproteobacteria bacterium RIFCSPLOWO2_02_FULL_40_19]OFX11721.1 MAG: hypothetical protein A3G22_04315 [Alphaproteobacteria bacterium RI
MRVRKFSEVQKNFTKIANEILRDHVPTIITSNSKEPLVMLSLEDFSSYEETLYLTRSPTNRKRLMESIENVKNEKYQHHNLIEHETN